MLQFIYATKLKDENPDLEVYGYNMPIWGLECGRKLRWEFMTPSIRLQHLDGYGISELFQHQVLKRAKLRGVPLRCEMLGSPDRFRQIFANPAEAQPLTDDDDLLINVRGAEILGAVHSDYGPIPVAWYRQLVEETGLKPVFLGQLGNDYYSELLQRSFPDARFYPSRGIIADFSAIRMARNVVLSISTFSWLAGWLSYAQTVHVPLLGLFNPCQRPDVWMLPLTDPRYCFYQFGMRRWEASDQQKQALALPLWAKKLEKWKLQELWRQNNLLREPSRKSALRRVARIAAISRIV